MKRQIYHRRLSLILQSFILCLCCLLNWSPLTSTKWYLTHVHRCICSAVHMAGIISCLPFPLQGPGAPKSRDCLSDSPTPAQGEQYYDCTLPFLYWPEMREPLIFARSNLQQMRTHTIPHHMYFVLLFQSLLRPWEAILVSILQFCWTYFEIHCCS